MKPKRIRKTYDPRTQLCLCGKPAVAEMYRNDFWCQDCIDKIPIVHELHNQEEYNYRKRHLEQDEIFLASGE